MADEVLVNDIDDIIRYKSEFNGFIDSLTDHMMKLQRALDEKVDELTDIKKQVQQEKEQLDFEIRQARSAYEASLDAGSYETEWYPDGSYVTHFVPDMRLRQQCQKEYEHLAGPVYHQMSHYALSAHTCHLDAIRHANLAENATKSNLDTIRRYVECGDDFLGQVIAYIESYMQSSFEK